MTTIHLINRLPTKILNFKGPIDIVEKLFPTIKLRNGLQQRVVGCVGYVHVYNPPLDKLSTKALKCVFVGY